MDYTTATASVTLSVLNPVPEIASLPPYFVSQGSVAFTMTVTGTGFMPNSTVYWGSSALTTKFVSSTQITAQVPASNTSTVGPVAITVQTPAPGGGTSNMLQFDIDSPTTTGPPQFGNGPANVPAGGTAKYPVTLPSTVTNVSASCLNLPAGTSCSYSSQTGSVQLTTSANTPAGTYAVTVASTETVPSVSASGILLPVLLVPLWWMRKLAKAHLWMTLCLALALLVGAVSTIGCGATFDAQ